MQETEEKVLKSPGKWIHLVYGGFFLAILFGVFFPIYQATKKLEQYCGELTPGASFEDLKTQTEARKNNFIPQKNGNVIIDDPRSLRRPACVLFFEDEKLVKSTFIN